TQTSNPHTSSQSAVWTVNNFDTLSRVTKVIPPDGTQTSNNMQYSYSGNSVTVTDPAGKQRKTFTDALGRLAQVYEPGYSDGVNASGSVTTTGSNRAKTIPPTPCPPDPPCIQVIWDTGPVTVTVGTYTATFEYGLSCDQGTCDDPSTIAAGLAAIFN